MKNRPGIEVPIPGLFSFFKFLHQSDADLHTVDEAVTFVVTAEGTDRGGNSLSFGKLSGNVDQLTAMCGLFFWGGERIAE